MQSPLFLFVVIDIVCARVQVHRYTTYVAALTMLCKPVTQVHQCPAWHAVILFRKAKETTWKSLKAYRNKFTFSQLILTIFHVSDLILLWKHISMTVVLRIVNHGIQHVLVRTVCLLMLQKESLCQWSRLRLLESFCKTFLTSYFQNVHFTIVTEKIYTFNSLWIHFYISSACSTECTLV